MGFRKYFHRFHGLVRKERPPIVKKGAHKVHRRFNKKTALRRMGKQRCFICDYSKVVDIHHVDKFHVVLLCPNCHALVHRRALSSKRLLSVSLDLRGLPDKPVGRPPGVPREKLTVYINKGLKEPFKKQCAEIGISASDGITRMIENALLSSKQKKRLFQPIKIRRKKS